MPPPGGAHSSLFERRRGSDSRTGLFLQHRDSLGGQATGLLVETHDGRPTKIEGNPDHPSSLGAATALQQACDSGLYDPDRSARLLEDGHETKKSWPEFEAYLKATLAGRRLAVCDS